MGVQACRLPALKSLKPLKSVKRLKPLKPLQPLKLCKSFSECPPAQAKATPRPHQWLLMGVQACRLPALKPLKPLKRLKPLQPLKFSKSFAERPTAQAKATPRPHPSLLLGGPACRSPGVTRFKPFKRFNILLACLIPQPTGTPRPNQWLLMGVQACRLPALKPLKPLKPLKRLKPLKPLQPLKLCESFSECPPAQAKATPRPHQWLLMGVQACRLPALKPLKPLKRLKRLKPLQPLKFCKSFAERPTAQAKATPRPQTLQKLLGTLTRTGKSYPKATSMASYGRPSLPFASP